jgi:hypothetical protein
MNDSEETERRERFESAASELTHTLPSLNSTIAIPKVMVIKEVINRGTGSSRDVAMYQYGSLLPSQIRLLCVFSCKVTDPI